MSAHGTPSRLSGFKTKSRWLKVLLWCFAVLAALGVAAWAFVNSAPFGALPEGARLERIKRSPHFKDGIFTVEEPFTYHFESSGFAAWWDFLFGSHPELRPQQALPSQHPDLKALKADEDVVVWLGHSSFFMQLGGLRVLVDPIFSGHASPFSFMMPAFPGSDVVSQEQIPDIDLLVISHDHWDHLDYETVTALRERIAAVACGLGVGAHFERWGFAPERIHELEWGESLELPGLKVTALPARHFSGRLRQNRSAPASWAFVGAKRRIYYTGDGGYSRQFAAIGRDYGPFDLAILEDGQYDRQWPDVHLMPEQLPKVARDVRVRAIMPVHNSKFVLARHAWQDPLERLSQALPPEFELLTPMIGQILKLDGTAGATHPWWRELR